MNFISRIFNAILRKFGKDSFLSGDIPRRYKIIYVLDILRNFFRWNFKYFYIPRINFLGRNSKVKYSGQLKIGKLVRIGDNVIVDCLSKKGVDIADNVNIANNVIIKCTWSLGHVGTGVVIGTGVSIGDGSFIGAAGGVIIGENVIMGQNVRFHSENHIFNDPTIPIKMQGVTNEGIIIEDDCWVGAGVVFLDGVKVGKGSVIGANSVVTKNIPPFSVVVGTPGRVIKRRG